MNERDFGFRQSYAEETSYGDEMVQYTLNQLRARIFAWMTAGAVIAGIGFLLFC